MAARSWVVQPDDVLAELDAIEEELREVDAPAGSCRYCGCDEEHACFPGEWWVRPGVCSSCVAVDVLNRGRR